MSNGPTADMAKLHCVLVIAASCHRAQAHAWLHSMIDARACETRITILSIGTVKYNCRKSQDSFYSHPCDR